MRFSKVIAVTFAAGPAGALAAYEKALSSYKPNPPAPNFDALIGWVLNGNDWVALGTIALAAVSTGYSIYQMFQPDPATKKDVKEDGRKTREGLEHLSRQGVAETDDILAEIQKLRLELLAKNEGNAQQVESFVTTATDLAGSESAEDRSIAREAVEGDPLAASDRLMAEVAAGVAEQAERARQAARIAAPFSVAKAITAYACAVELDPGDFWTWIELSRLHRAAGSLPPARQTAEAALQHVGGDYERMVAEGELGRVAIAERKLPAAAEHFTSAMQAARAIADAAPDDLHLQRQLSVAHNMLGDIAVAQGDLAGARTAYDADHAIAQRLAEVDPGNAKWQRDLSVSYSRLGNVAVDEGDLVGARTAYGAGLAIAQRLAEVDPGNAEWQRDSSVSHNKLGDVAVAQGDLLGARTAYGAGLAIAQRLAEVDPGNAEWQRDVFISHAKFAQFKETSGDVAGAIREFEAGEAILVALIARVGDHPGFARDLAQVRGDIARLRGE